MSSLILTVFSLLLLSAVVTVSINYLPGWSKEAADVSPVVRASAAKLERAFDLYAKSHSGVPAPVVSGDVDGGLSAQFSPYLGFVPAAIPGYRWVYGNAGGGAPGAYQNAYYFCLAPTNGAASQGKVRGVVQAQQYFSAEAAFVSTGCGSTSNTTYSAYPATMTLTVFVKYVAGQV